MNRRFFDLTPNIDSKGRLLRGVGAALSAGAAALCFSHSVPATIALAAASAFLGFEALRGWCALRACGIKTRV